MPVPHHSVFTGRMPFLPPNQQRQSTEGTSKRLNVIINFKTCCYSTGSQRMHHRCLLVNNFENIDHRQVWACPGMTPKSAHSCGESEPPFNTWYLGPLEFTSQMASILISSAILQGSLLCPIDTRQATKQRRQQAAIPHILQVSVAEWLARLTVV